MKPLQCPVIQHHLDKELEAIWPEFIKSVENPLFERMLWWILPRCVCINRFRQRALLRDYKLVGCWSSVNYHTYLERLLCHLIPDNFLARHLVHWIFHDIPRGGVCPVDGIKTRAVETAVKWYDYLAFHQSTLLFAHRMLYNDIVARQATDALAQLSDALDDTRTKGGEEYSSGAESACSGDILDDAPAVVREEPKPLKANRTRGMAPSRRVLHGAADGTQKLSPYLDSAYEDIDTEQLGLELEFCMLRSSRLHLVARYNSKVGLAEHAEELASIDTEIKAHQKAMDANRQVKESRRRIAAFASLQQQPRDEASPLETRSDHREPSDASSSVDGPAHSLESEQSASLPTVTPDSPVVADSAAADSETPASQDASDADTVPPSAQQQVRSNVCADAAVLAPVATANDTAACGLHPTAQDASDANVMPASTQQQIQSDHDMDAVLSPPVDEATSNATAETAMAVTPAAAMAEAARAFYIRHKTRAPNATVTRPRQQIPYAALSLNRIAVTRLRNPHDSSKSIKRVIPIRGRQQLMPKARSKATRVDLRYLGLGLGKINPVVAKHRVVNATSTVRPSGGLALRDNRLRRRHRVYSALVKRARQRQRANKRQAARDCALSNRHSAGPEAMECAGASAPVMVTPPTMAVDAPPAIPQPAATLPATQAFEPPVPAQQAFVLPAAPAFVPPVPVPPVIPAFVPTVARPPAFTPPVPVPPVTPVFAPPVPVPQAFVPLVAVPPAFVPTVARPPAFMQSVPVPQALVPSVPVPPVTPVFAPSVTPGFTPPVAVPPTLVPPAFMPPAAVPPVPTLPIAPPQVASPPAPAPPVTAAALLPHVRAARQRAEAIRGAVVLPYMAPPAATLPVSSPPVPALSATPAAFVPPNVRAARQRAEAIRGAVALPDMAPPAAAPPVGTRAATTPVVAPRPSAAPPAPAQPFVFQTGVAQPPANIPAPQVIVRRNNRNGRHGNDRARHQPSRAPSDTNTYGEHASRERKRFSENNGKLLRMFPKVLDRRLRIGTRVATPHTLAIDRMYFALLYILASDRKGASTSDTLLPEVRALYNADDRTVYDRYQAEIGRHAQQPIEGVDESAF
ncbi:hypothetical protein H4218_003084 [Coemansia sp. IMI 209128]|nr:hypothetical protein H4218_003084 [Coemansia sp. IMI 209128]